MHDISNTIKQTFNKLSTTQSCTKVCSCVKQQIIAGLILVSFHRNANLIEQKFFALSLLSLTIRKLMNAGLLSELLVANLAPDRRTQTKHSFAE